MPNAQLVQHAQIELQIETMFEKLRPHNMPLCGACLVWTYCTISVLTLHNIRSLIQAGTCLWPRMRKDQDDGKCLTHFGYVWSPNTKESEMAVLTGHMPEIHIWTAIPDEQIIIDMSSGMFPYQCRELIDQDWPGDRPPRHFWCNVNAIPEGVIYKSSIPAIKYASNAMLRFIKEDL